MTATSLVVRLAALILAIMVATWISSMIKDALDIQVMPANEIAVHRMILIAISAYTLLMMTPFVPGAEIGIAMLAAFGSLVAPLVYGATVVALVAAFVIGRLVPERVVVRALRALRLEKAASGVEHILTLSADERLQSLMAGSNPRLVKLGTRYRYVALCIAINMPGNFLIGGGGGIALMAGISRLFSPLPYLLTVAIAVAPVPLFVLLFGA